MRAVIQRVSRADVKVEDKVVGSIEAGLLVYLGLHQSDGPELIPVLVDKIINLRIFPNEEGRFDRSLQDGGGGLLVVSQFTLYGDCRKGRRPSFQDAAPPERARALYEKFLECAAGKGIQIAAGVFQAHMEVSSVNDGPVTIIMDLPNQGADT
ncbi:MAG TPA: D-aminoacyl-tRNA deacylase [Oligoflexus sp.]|uniref:D-aminoacyl-tRNA deacylase n=1 Tax=Oligoflexus sp. TaxID=1971216 RepID=UPI002D22754F|nr:D-aminoacyl-tRNA deacylase [Oligoflexus sp.]HYX39184.1 D-aminoacyl-tRNA deacylase [Oligoflexus sp.]